MKTFPLLGRVGAVTVLGLSLAACGLFPPQHPAPRPLPRPDPARTRQDEVIHFAMTDRFANGATANDNGPDRNAGDIIPDASTPPGANTTGSGQRAGARDVHGSG